MLWKINFLRKVRYDTDAKQRDDLYGLRNTVKE